VNDAVRCPWCLGHNELMVRYHDEEWGVPVHDDTKHFEFMMLESAQAGLSWSTVLNKREGYRRAFAQFDVQRVARFNSRSVERLIKDASIIRNRLKIESAISNARLFIDVQDEFGSFDDYIWRFVDGRQKLNRWNTHKNLPATSRESDALSRDLKARGFRFVGSTIVYAHMQAAGLINDHLVSCFRYDEVSETPS
jgi:DNA-3-methyladenine glycosylase I